MSFDPHDDDGPGFGLRRKIADEASVNASAGYSIPATPFRVVPYKSLAVAAMPSASMTFDVTVTWDFDGEAGGGTVSETKTSTSLAGETLVFRNQGVQVVDVTITGDAATAYWVGLSDADPLAEAASASEPVYPFAQTINLSVLFDFGDTGGTLSIQLDPLVRSNHYIQTINQNGYLTFMFLMGPQYARHEVLYTVLRGPDCGIITPRLARLGPNEGAGNGYVNPLELIESWFSNPVTWVTLGAFAQDCVAGAVARNITSGIPMRVQGAEGDPFTATSSDADGYFSVNGGPGIYAMQLRALTKNVASTGYRMKVSELSVHRIDAQGFP